MCAEASTVLRTVAADFYFNCWYVEIPSGNRIRHIPRCVHLLVQSVEQYLQTQFRSSQKTNCVIIGTTSRLVLLQEIVAAYSEKHTKRMSVLREQNAILFMCKHAVYMCKVTVP
jgi:hypothetical protein